MRTDRRTTASQANLALLEFEAAFGEALKNRRNLAFSRRIDSIDWARTLIAEGRGLVVVTHEVGGRKRATIGSPPSSHCLSHFQAALLPASVAPVGREILRIETG
jgi:hypothetical protein